MRDASLVVIASEDEYAVRQYFDFFQSSRIQFRVLPTADGRGAPDHVLARLDDYLREFEIGEGDVFWLVVDRDHWAEPNHIHNLTAVLRACRQKDIRVAISNPCFDLWLLLHFTEPPVGDGFRCQEIGELIRSAVGQYDKTKVYNLPITDERVRDAVKRATDRYPSHEEIPSRPQPAIHLIIQSLVEKRVISVRPAPGAGNTAKGMKKPKGKK